jgi:hypothetical protein
MSSPWALFCSGRMRRTARAVTPTDLSGAARRRSAAPHINSMQGNDMHKGHTYSEAYRHECEVAYVCDLPTVDQRRDYLDYCDRKRKPEQAARLRSDVRTLFLARRQGGGAPFPQQSAAGDAPSVGVNRAVNDGSGPGFGSFLGTAHEGNSNPDRRVDSGGTA